MTEEMVRDGFKNRSLFQSVPLEFCTDEEQMINRFKSPQFIDKLGDLMSQVYEIKERQEVVPRPVPPFDPPRKKGGMEKREPWLTSLGEGESLLSLSRTLPHGVKEILPDGLMKRLMPFPRANWLVKVVGCDEQRIPTHSDFPLRWTESLEKYLSEKIRELSTEAGEGKKNAVKVSNPPSSKHSSLSDLSISQIQVQYVLRLCKWQCDEKLLDQYHLLAWAITETGLVFFFFFFLLTHVSLILCSNLLENSPLRTQHLC